MISKESDFYERYWENPGSAPPHRDPTTPVRLWLLSKYAGGSSGKAALDLGCGIGIFTKALAEAGFKPIGIDLSTNAVKAAKARYPSLRFETHLENGKLPIGSESVDLVWCSEVLEHVFDVWEFLAEINRVMKPKGLLILTTPYHGFAKNMLIIVFKFASHFDPYSSHIRFFDRESLKRILTDTGFSVEKWSGYGRIWLLYRSFCVCAKKTSLPCSRPLIQG